MDSVENVKRVMRNKKTGVFWLPNVEKSGQPGTRYLCGFSGSDSHLVITENMAYLLTDGRYIIAAKKEAPGCAVIDIGKLTFQSFFKKILSGEDGKKLLVDGSVVSLSAIEKIQAAVAGVEILNAGGFLKEIRRLKTADEIKLLKKAALIACQTFKKILPIVKPGVSEKWLANRIKNLLFECGAHGLAFDPIVASGGNAAFPHAIPGEKKLKKGELVVLDFGAVYEGYVSDITRTVAVGKISPKLRRIYEVVKEAQALGCESARAGTPARAMDSVCRDFIGKTGYGKYFVHSTGHGIGMEVHELPSISPNSKDILQKGDAFTCEPGIYIKSVGGVRIEDSLLIDEKSTLNLTLKAGKNLIVL